MRRFILYSACCLLLMVFAACKPTKQQCHIHGTLPSDKYNGTWIYLVPQYRPDSVGVDSTQVKGRQFEIVTDKQMIAILRMHYKNRYGLQDLLVVTEPGNVEVVIDSISSGSGTIQNDSLQVWKNITEAYIRQMRTAPDSMRADILNTYKQRTIDLGHNIGENTTLGKFLLGLCKTPSKKAE